MSSEKIDFSSCVCELLVEKDERKTPRSLRKTWCKSVKMTFSSFVISILCLQHDSLGNGALTLFRVSLCP